MSERIPELSPNNEAEIWVPQDLPMRVEYIGYTSSGGLNIRFSFPDPVTESKTPEDTSDLS